MELTLNFQPAAEWVQSSADSLKNGIIKTSEKITSGAEQVHEHLFGTDGETWFTLSGVGSLAAAQYNPSMLTVGIVGTAFGSSIISEMNDPDDCMIESGDENQMSEYASDLKKEADLQNLAITNTVATVASYAIFGNNTLGLVTLAATTFARIML